MATHTKNYYHQLQKESEMGKKQMTFREALIAARPLIASYKVGFICYALARVTGHKRYCKRIERQLEGCASYGRWLCLKHYETWRCMDFRDFRDGRLQWIDYMIAQEEARGR